MKILRLSTGFGPIETQTNTLCKPAEEIESHYLFPGDEDPVDIDFESYDCIWVYTDERFPEEFPQTYTKLMFSDVRKVNMKVALHNTQYGMTNVWWHQEYDVPEIHKLYRKGEFPTKLPRTFMVKANRSYTRNSYATVVHNLSDLNKWGHWKDFDYILQDYRDDYAKPYHDDLYYLPDAQTRQSDDLHYCGQVYRTGDKFFERSLRWTNHWYVSPTHRGLPHLGLRVGEGSFLAMPGQMEIIDFWDQIKLIYDSVGVEIGTLDFSINDKGHIVPWGICTLYLFYCEGSDAHGNNSYYPSPQEQIPIQVEYFNNIMEYLGAEYRTDANEVWRVINGNNLNL